MKRSVVLIASFALLIAACSDDDVKVGANNPVSNTTAEDAGDTSIGTSDDAGSGSPDGGGSLPDAGEDAGSVPDTGQSDMGQSDMGQSDMDPSDMGMFDGGPAEDIGVDMALTCNADEMLCGGVCAPCPAPDNVAAFACDQMTCEVSMCEVGFELCPTGCCPPAMPAMSGRASSADFTALDTSIALDPDGYPRIVYRNFFTTNIEQSAWDGRQWVTEVIETGVDPYVTNIAIDQMGRTHASWWETDTLALRYARQTATGWNVQTVASQIGGYNSLALDSQGRPHLVFQDEALKVLKHTRWNGSAWVTTDVYTLDPSALFPYAQLAIDAMDRPRVAFGVSTDFTVRFAAWDGAAWQVEDVATTGGVPQYIDLAIDGSGQGFIAYRAMSNLHMARRMAGSWTVVDVDTSGDWGRTSTIRLDNAGLPHILTHGNAQDVARIFSFDGAAWQTTDVLGGANVTEGVSMVLDSTDAMHLSMGTKAPPVHLEYQLIP